MRCKIFIRYNKKGYYGLINKQQFCIIANRDEINLNTYEWWEAILIKQTRKGIPIVKALRRIYDRVYYDKVRKEIVAESGDRVYYFQPNKIEVLGWKEIMTRKIVFKMQFVDEFGKHEFEEELYPDEVEEIQNKVINRDKLEAILDELKTLEEYEEEWRHYERLLFFKQLAIKAYSDTKKQVQELESKLEELEKQKNEFEKKYGQIIRFYDDGMNIQIETNENYKGSFTFRGDTLAVIPVPSEDTNICYKDIKIIVEWNKVRKQLEELRKDLEQYKERAEAWMKEKIEPPKIEQPELKYKLND